MTNDPDRPQIDDVERCRQVRRNLEIKHGGLDGLFAHFAKLELKKRKRRVTKVRAIGRKRVTQKNS